MDRPMSKKVDHELVAAAKVIQHHYSIMLPPQEFARMTMRVNDWETVEFGWWRECDSKKTRQCFSSFSREHALNMATVLSYLY